MGDALPAAARRVAPLDWMRGAVMVLMTVDHASGVFNAGRVMRDAVWRWQPGDELPAAQFLLRWVTHVCAPTFVLLAGAAVALSWARRARSDEDARGFDRHLFVRGAIVWALDPAWMSFVFTGGRPLFQVMYALGASMMALAFLRRLPPRVLLAIAAAILLGAEALGDALAGSALGEAAVTKLLLSGGRVGPVLVAYPLLPWLAIMLLGYVAGLGLARAHAARGAEAGSPARGVWMQWPRAAALAGLAMCVAFAALRGANAYGNGHLLRDSAELVQWLHVAKYPPSLTFTLLELGLAFLALAAFGGVADRFARAHRVLAPLEVLGRTALFFYVLHAHLMGAFGWLTGTWRTLGIGGTLLAAALCVGLLWPLCARYDRYKRAHPSGWTRYL